MSDLIDRQIAISAICNACGKIDCDKMDKCEKLQLPPANNSETPNSSDTISRAKAIEALKNDMASLDHIIKGMSANDVRLDAYVSQRNQVNYDIYTINNLPAVQSEQLGTNLAEVGTDCISRQAAIDAIDSFNVFESRGDQIKLEQMIGELPPAEPKRIRGKWMHDGSKWKNRWICSNCGYKWFFDCIEGAYCPNCGAGMEVAT